MSLESPVFSRGLGFSPKNRLIFDAELQDKDFCQAKADAYAICCLKRTTAPFAPPLDMADMANLGDRVRVL